RLLSRPTTRDSCVAATSGPPSSCVECHFKRCATTFSSAGASRDVIGRISKPLVTCRAITVCSDRRQSRAFTSPARGGRRFHKFGQANQPKRRVLRSSGGWYPPHYLICSTRIIRRADERDLSGAHFPGSPRVPQSG